MASFDFISCRKEEVVSQFVCVRQSILLKCSDTVQRTNLLAQMYAPDLTVYRCFESCNQDWFSANKFGSNHDRVKISINPWVFFREEFSQKALPCVYLSSCQKCIDPPWKYLIARSCSVSDFFSPCHRTSLVFREFTPYSKNPRYVHSEYRSSFFFILFRATYGLFRALKSVIRFVMCTARIKGSR